MFTIVAYWLVVFFISFSFGLLATNLLSKYLKSYFDNKNVRFWQTVFLGLFSIYFIGTLFNFYFRLNTEFLTILLCSSVIILLVNRKYIFDYFRLRLSSFLKKKDWLFIIFFISLASIAIIKSCCETEVFQDEKGYHLPYIRWIENFRLIKGLGNVEDRIGFNSASDLLSAVFGFSMIFKGGLYDINGFYCVILATYFIKGFSELSNAKYFIFNLTRSLAFIFLLRNQFTGAASDWFAIYLGIAVFCMILKKYADGNIHVFDTELILIILFITFIVVTKFSAITLFLWVAFMLFPILVKRKVEILKVFLLVAVIFGFWLLRNYYLSGYLIYPVYKVDIGNAVWKVPAKIAKTQYFYVSEFAKTNCRKDDAILSANASSTKTWIPKWFKRELKFPFYLFTFLMFTLSIVLAMFMIYKKKIYFEENKAYLWFISLDFVLILIWFLNHPAMRFGYGFVYTFYIFIFGLFILKSFPQKLKLVKSFTILFFSIMLAFNLYSTAKDSKNISLLYPAQIGIVDGTAKIIGDVNFFVTNKHCWGTQPPCVYKINELQMTIIKTEDSFMVIPK